MVESMELPAKTRQFAWAQSASATLTSLMRALLESDQRLAPSIHEDEERQAALRRCLDALEQD